MAWMAFKKIDVLTLHWLQSEDRSEQQWRPSRRSKSEGPPRSAINEEEKTEREHRRESDPDVENMVKNKQKPPSQKTIFGFTECLANSGFYFQIMGYISSRFFSLELKIFVCSFMRDI